MTKSARMQTFLTVFTQDLSLQIMFQRIACSMGKPTSTRFSKIGMELFTPTSLNNRTMYYLMKIHTTSILLQMAFSSLQLWISLQLACLMTGWSQSITITTQKQSNIPRLYSIF